MEISKKLSGKTGRRYVVIDPHLSDERLEKLKKLHLKGVSTEPVLLRDYPQDKLAGQVIGFVGRDGKGLTGLEARFDKMLRPEPGRMAQLRNAQRQPLWMQTASYRPHHNGDVVRLSLDVVIQSFAEVALAKAVDDYGADHGELIVMDPETGEVLAMASYPGYDPNDFQDAPADQRRNRCVTDFFEPGSIFKPFIWAIATQLGEAKPDEMIDVTTSGYYVSPQGRRLRDSHGHGVISWDKVLVLSSNIGMAKVGQRMGIEKMYQAVRAFGFGQTTGSELPGEVRGLVRPASKWTHYSVTSIPMGQEIGVTPLQIMRAFCAIANDGLLVTPTVRAIDRSRGLPIRERVLLPGVAAHTREVLRRVVTEGTGTRAQSDLYRIFGKTGTAQMPNLKEGGYYQHRYVASFVGGAPVDKPRLVVGCFVHDPDRKKGHYGGTVSAPAVKEVLERSLRYLNVPTLPSKEDEQLHTAQR